MSQFPPAPPPAVRYPPPGHVGRLPGPQPGSALAITAFVLALVGIIFPPAGLVALILGIIALARGTAAKGLAIASVCIAPLSMIGVLLSAPGQARRQAARQLVSSSQVNVIGNALVIYAQEYGAFPEPGADWQKRLTDLGYVPAELFTAPGAEPGTTSYHYIPQPPPASPRFDPSGILVYETPGLWRTSLGRIRGGNVYFNDGRVEFADDYESLAKRLDAQRQAAEANRPK